MNRRSLLGGAAALVTAGCAGGDYTADKSEIERRWPPEGMIVRSNGLGVHTWDKGAGQPVILLHGASGNLRDWTFGLAQRIAERRRAIAFDRPGHGYSERPDERGGDPAVQARILQAAARELGVERPILVGHSWGAALAMSWALADPDGVAGVVTVSGAVMPWSAKPFVVERLGLEETLVGAYLNYIRSTAKNGGVERFVRRIFRPQDPPKGYVAHVGGPLSLRETTQIANREDIATLNRALRRQAPDYGRVRIPVEVVSGREDPIIRPQRHPIPFTERLLNARLTLLDGVGHMAHHARPDALMSALDRLDPVSA